MLQFCSCGRKIEYDNSDGTIQCSKCNKVHHAKQNPNPWLVIHKRLADRILSGEWDKDSEMIWYANEWLPSIPKDSCPCQDHWSSIVSNNPINWETAESAFWCFHRLHNVVSSDRSHKPTITKNQAEVLWLGKAPVRKKCIIASDTVTLEMREHATKIAREQDADYYEMASAPVSVAFIQSRYSEVLFLEKISQVQ